MKSKFTTSLALVAVLLTGTAAAAINTQALNGPTESTISTGATTLLPATESVAIIPGQAETQVTTTSPSQNGVSPTPAIASPVTKQSATSITSAPTKSSLVFANPNPSTGDDDEGHDNEEDDEDEDEDEDEDDD